uniref:S1 motif domain-containing protein n=2 Tax=Corethron hystrix TaxID=216773 RepID=A0A7S1BQZ2_9STRA|mmetsp:Transcript_37980/g.88360  ORF Transcript_37980/g.88360 Transcript_37980/m.88360 type:complete len:223 (+) Transcript_37980:467-1135(+)
MMRLGKRGSRISASKKRAAAFGRQVNGVELFVTAVRPEQGGLEVSSSKELAEETALRKKCIRASNIAIGTEMIGTVCRVEDYGVIVDVGANRHGLLHIQRVADMMGRYIDKARELSDEDQCGLGVGSKIKVRVVGNRKRKGLELDFTDETKAIAEEEQKKNAGEMAPHVTDAKIDEITDEIVSEPSDTLNADEIKNEEEYEEEYEEDDEDFLIEEMMGLDSW